MTKMTTMINPNDLHRLAARVARVQKAAAYARLADPTFTRADRLSRRAARLLKRRVA